MIAQDRQKQKRAVFLDRDGVINTAIVRNGKPYPPNDILELEIVQDAPQALNRLKAAGFILIVVTNQPDVARGKQNLQTVNFLHREIAKLLPIDEFRVCCHDDTDKCECRKPKPGMLLAAAGVHNLSLANSYLIGDRWRDIAAGQSVGCTSLFIDYRYDDPLPSGEFVKVYTLTEAVDWILKQEMNND